MNDVPRSAGGAGGGSPPLWIVAAWVPTLADLSLFGSLAWGGALLVGALLASGRAPRWVAIAWCVAVVVPATSQLGIAASGAMLKSWAHHLLAAVLGVALGVVLPVELRDTGSLLLLTSVSLAFFGTRR